VLKIHTSDGRTQSVDLADAAQAREWLGRLAREGVQGAITGVTLTEKHAASGRCPACGVRGSHPLGVQFSISRPQDFGIVSLAAERVEQSGRVKGGEKVLLFADDVRLSVMAHAEQPAVRVVLSKVGKRRFDPNTRLGNEEG